MVSRKNNQNINNPKIDPKLSSAINFTAGQFGAKTARFEASGTDAMIEGMDVFSKVFTSEGNNPNKFGHLFEAIETTKFNVDAARKNSNLNAQLTSNPTNPLIVSNRTSKVDILIQKKGKTVLEVQAKCSDPNTENGNAWMANQIRQEKYKGQQRVVPKDAEPKVRKLVEKRSESNSIYSEEYKDAKNNLSGETHYENVTTNGTSSKEIVFSHKNPKLYASLMEGKQLTIEAGTAALGAATSASIISGGISLIKNGGKFLKGDMDGDETVKTIINETVSSVTQSAVAGATGAGIRFVAEKTALKMGTELATKSGISVLTKSNVATAVASTLIDTGVAIYSYSKGDISAEDCMIQMGENGFGFVNGLYFAGVGNAAVTALSITGLAATAITTAVSMGGFILATYAYQSCISILKNAQLAEEEAIRVQSICEESICQMKEQRRIFELKLEQLLQYKETQISLLIESLDHALESDDFVESLKVLNDIAYSFGTTLKFPSFEAFDKMMLSDEPLRL